MGYMDEYISRKLSSADLEKELLSLISQYNKARGTFLLVHTSAIGKAIPDVALSQEDYYIIADILRTKNDLPKIDVYLETPGGSGEAAEEIVNFLRSRFKHVSFVVSGEAKSAGTIMVLSGDDILMTETGSLGPIDAQLKIGRGPVSAYDYMEWIGEKYKEAEEKNRLNPFDAIMVAQISPGELKGVDHALKFAEDLVVEWLKKYKFKNWERTETRGIPVTDAMKEQRARDIVRELINHAKWRSHGRSIKIRDLQGDNIKLKIINIDEDTALKEIVYRIQTVCKLLFTSTTTYKIFATEGTKIFKQGVSSNIPVRVVPPATPPLKTAEVAEIGINCPKCGKAYKFYAKFKMNPKIDEDHKKKGCIAFPKDNKISCDCGYEINLTGIRNDLETKTGAKILD